VLNTAVKNSETGWHMQKMKW